jgi:hypothetical protein
MDDLERVARATPPRVAGSECGGWRDIEAKPGDLAMGTPLPSFQHSGVLDDHSPRRQRTHLGECADMVSHASRHDGAQSHETGSARPACA